MSTWRDLRMQEGKKEGRTEYLIWIDGRKEGRKEWENE
jgi:hypothetical protein